MSRGTPDRRGLGEALVGDGRPLLHLAAILLLLSGCFAWFQSATGHFLPHDVDYLGMSAKQLCRLNGCRIVHFMFHDRVAFGGVLVGIGILYLWLTEFPLRGGEAWAWWALAVSGAVGFTSFLTYLGTGYLDTWHGAATLPLLLVFGGGLFRARALLAGPPAPDRGASGNALPWCSRTGLGRLLLLGTAVGQIGAGATISIVGMTSVFVPQDLVYMGVTAADLDAISPRLVPLIAHDRAGFGGALLSSGLAWLACVWWGRPSPSLWQALLLAGCAGFAAAVGVHFAVGYTDFIHLAPAVAGVVVFAAGIALSFSPMHTPGRSE